MLPYLVVALLLSACVGALNPRGASLQLDGRTLAISKTCTFTSSSNCESARIAPNQVWCNSLGHFGTPGILVILTPPQSLEVAADQVIWTQQREVSVVAKGGVTNFSPTQGADLNVTFAGSKHLSGTIRC